ncbi:MAG: SPFH domain-containing protein [Patescibacteria group bacterium]
MLNVVLFVLGLLSLGYFVVSKNGILIQKNQIIQPATRQVRNLFLVLSLVFFFASLGAIKIIASDERGLRFTFGAVSEKALQPGLHFSWPIVQTVKSIQITPIELETDIPVTEEGAITRDNQTIGAQLAIFYIYKENELPFMVKNFGPEKLKSIILKSMMESFKAQVGRYDIFVLPMSQDSIRIKTLKQIRQMVLNYPVTITELKITNYDWSDDFDNQIKETMNRSQQVKQKEQEKLMAEQEAQKGVVQATAKKQIAITLAEGAKAAAQLNADAKALEGEGIRKYNESIAKNIDLEIRLRTLKIEEIRVQRWNGVYVPNNSYGPIPFQTGGLQGVK